MFILQTDEEVILCQGCETLKKLEKTRYFSEQFFCSKPGITYQLACERASSKTFVHQCDDCELLGEKRDGKGVLYYTCLSPKNTKNFGRWVKAVTSHVYFLPNEICKFKPNREK